MSGQSPPLEALTRAVNSFLDQIGLKYTRRDDGWIRLMFGDITDAVVVWVLPQEWAKGDTLVQVMSIVRTDVRTGVALDVFLAEENGKLLFGKLVVEPDKSEVRFTQPLLGNFLNRAELQTAIGIAASMAQTYDDVVAEKFGGRKPD